MNFFYRVFILGSSYKNSAFEQWNNFDNYDFST